MIRWKHIFGPLEKVAPIVSGVLREMDAIDPTVHSQEAVKLALAHRLGTLKPEEPPEENPEHAYNMVAHIQREWSDRSGVGKDAERPGPIMFEPQWLADFTAEWDRCLGSGKKWDIFRRPNGEKIADLTKPTADREELERRASQLMEAGLLGKPPGERKPQKVDRTPRSEYKRCPDVIAWVMQTAHGVCECCQSAAPFNRPNGTPYLEPHHAVQLAHGGPDTEDNVIAVCPNCHRMLHSGHDRAERLDQLYHQVKRLVRYPNREVGND
jgi:HNH endonuclease